MFCPNCGTDCQSGKFCPNCGQDLRPQSGGLEKAVTALAPPVGKYEIDSKNYVELTDDAVIIQKKNVFYKPTTRQIPYNEIRRVSFGEADRHVLSGFLSVRDRNNRSAPAETSDAAYSDETSITFSQEHNNDFAEVYRFLKSLADANAENDPVWTSEKYETAMLAENPVQEVKALTPPVGKYEVDSKNYVELTDDAVIIQKKNVFYKPTTRQIPYNEIRRVSFGEADRHVLSGFLSVRDRNNRSAPAETSDAAYSDEMSITFSRERNSDFAEVYRFLKSLADVNAEKDPVWTSEKYEAAMLTDYPVQEVKALTPPVGKYGSDPKNYVELTDDAVIIHKKLLMEKLTMRRIPYNEIRRVSICEAVRLGSIGFLSIRDRKNRSDPVETWREAVHDETSIIFSTVENSTFMEIYRFLRSHADANASDPKMISVEKEIQELEESNQVYCPKCKSTSVTAGQRGYNSGLGLLGKLARGDIGLLGGFIGSGQIRCTCLKCGYSWTPGKK